MRFGSCFGAGFGAPQNMVGYRKVYDYPSRFELVFEPAPGWGDAVFGIYRDSQFIRNIVAAEGVRTPPIPIRKDRGQTNQSILILRLGHILDTMYAIPRVARTFETEDSQRTTITWTWLPESLGAEDPSYLTSWVGTGVSFANLLHDVRFPYRGFLRYSMTVTAGTATITLSNGQTVCSGSGAVGGSVTLSEANDSGLSFTVTVDAGAVTSSGKIWYRWPASMLVKRSAAGAGVYSTVATVLFNEQDDALWTEGSNLPSTGYDYKLQPVSDTGVNGSLSSVLSATIPQPPAPPTNLAFLSGDADATILSFTGSTTSGASYRAYLAQPGGVMNLSDTPAATAIAGSTQITLPAITVPGTAYVILRAVKTGVEEQNLAMLPLEYLSDKSFVPARPNTPSIDMTGVAVTSGRTLSVLGVYNNRLEAGVATQLKLFHRTPTGSYNFASADDTQALATCRANPNLKTATLTYTFGADGFYYVTLKAVTAGGTLSAVEAEEVLVEVSNGTMGAPTGSEIFVSRG